MTNDDFRDCLKRLLAKKILEADEKVPGSILTRFREAWSQEILQYDSLGAMERDIQSRSDTLSKMREQKGLIDSSCVNYQVQSQYIEYVYIEMKEVVKEFERTGRKPQFKKLDS